MISNQYSAPERQYSDVVGVQQGVEDKSAATKAAGQISALDVGLKAGVSAFQSHEASQYEELLREEADMIEQGVPRAKVNAWRTKKEKEISSIVPFQERLKMRSRFDNAFGGVLTEKTFEEMQEEADQKLSLELGVDYRTPEGAEAVASYRRVQNATGQDAAQVATGLMPTMSGQAQTIVDSGLPFPEIKIQLTNLLNQVRQDAATKIGDKSLRDLVIAQYTDLFTAYQDSVDPAKAADMAANLNKLTEQKRLASLYGSMAPDESALLSLSNALGPNGSVMLKQEWIKSTPDLLKRTTESFKALEDGTYNPSSVGGANLTKTISDAAGQAASNGDSHEGTTKAINTMVNESSYKLPTAKPDDVKALIEGLAGGIGEYYKLNPDKFDVETKNRFGEALRGHFQDVVQPLVAQALEEEVGSKIGRVGAKDKQSSVERIGLIDLVASGDRLMFTTDYSEAKRNVELLNKNISGDLSTYAKALANVTNESLEEQAAHLKSFLFPESLSPEDAPKGSVDPTRGVAPVSQENVPQGLSVAPDEAVALERTLEERTLADAVGTPYEEDYKQALKQLDSVKDPSLRYVLKKQYSNLLLDISSSRSSGASAGGRSGKVGKTYPKTEGAPKFTGPQMEVGSKLLGEVPEEVRETAVPTLGDAMFNEIAEVEGSGSSISGDVPTAHYGVTAAAAKAVGAEFDEGMSREQAKEISVAYLNLLNDKFSSKVSNWESLPEGIRMMAVDTAYNVGEKVLSYKGFMGDLKAGKTADQVARNILDTANAGGKSMRGLAVRRAEAYNKVAANKIASVEQKRNGEIIYYDSEDRVIFSYKTDGGKHPDSRAEKEFL